MLVTSFKIILFQNNFDLLDGVFIYFFRVMLHLGSSCFKLSGSMESLTIFWGESGFVSNRFILQFLSCGSTLTNLLYNSVGYNILTASPGKHPLQSQIRTHLYCRQSSTTTATCSKVSEISMKEGHGNNNDVKYSPKPI